jgi:hypothetical protein
MVVQTIVQQEVEDENVVEELNFVFAVVVVVVVVV